MQLHDFSKTIFDKNLSNYDNFKNILDFFA